MTHQHLDCSHPAHLEVKQRNEIWAKSSIWLDHINQLVKNVATLFWL